MNECRKMKTSTKAHLKEYKNQEAQKHFFLFDPISLLNKGQGERYCLKYGLFNFSNFIILSFVLYGFVESKG